MNFKTLLLTSAVVFGAANAMAADINNPFYLPEEGKMLSETSVEYSRANMNKDKNQNEGWRAEQELSYGLGNGASVLLGIGNNFDNKVSGVNGAYNNSHNFDYTIGAKYNKDFGSVKTQWNATYNTYSVDSYQSGDVSNSWSKFVNLGVKAGTELEGGLTPYVSFDANYGLNTVNNEAEKYTMGSPNEGKWTYSTFAGAYKAFDGFSVDGGVRWDNVRRDAGKTSEDSVYAQLGVDYDLSEDMSVGLYGDYLIGDSYMAEIDYVYTVGANLKVAF